jgi:type VII secretion effector (TIGR04197 family)
MVDPLQVNLNTLSQYVTTLTSAQQQLAGLPKILSGNDNHLGNDQLNDAAEDFQSSWEHGAKQLGEAVTETTKLVKAMRNSYLKVDSSAAAAVANLLRRQG